MFWVLEWGLSTQGTSDSRAETSTQGVLSARAHVSWGTEESCWRPLSTGALSGCQGATLLSPHRSQSPRRLWRKKPPAPPPFFFVCTSQVGS